MASVAVLAATLTEASEPPEGTLASVQPVLQAAWRLAEKTALTWSTLPLWLLSYMARVTSTVGAGGTAVGAPVMTIRAMSVLVLFCAKGEVALCVQVTVTSIRSTSGWTGAFPPAR